MNYAEQERYLYQSKIWTTVFALLLLLAAAASAAAGGSSRWQDVVVSSLVILTLAASNYYTPDYLHINVTSEKKPRWEFKIRWRLIAFGLILGMFYVSGLRGAILLVGTILWAAAANLLARSYVPHRYFPAYYWATDLVLIFTILLATHASLMMITVLLVAAAHQSIVIIEKKPWRWTTEVLLSGGVLIFFGGMQGGSSAAISITCLALFLTSGLTTTFLVSRAKSHNAKNVAVAMRELMDFTGYSNDRVFQLWSNSHEQLAKNWESAHLAENDREQMEKWYRDNSELYLFDLSGYNLEYKRIISNLGMLKYGRGRCLDYGAGNGEMILELARRGHAATYFDVDGLTMKFARERAKKRGLTVEFLSSKPDLSATARKRGFDTVYSLDVLEHLTDLQAELTFLASLLNPGGLLLFDVPAGTTKSHPMHLEHRVDFRTHLVSLGFKEERRFLDRPPFHKQEKYLFRAPLESQLTT